MQKFVVHFSGHVQGVGFRMTTRQIARNFDVTGSVKNLDDGRVRLVAEGAESELKDFVGRIQERMGGHIRDTQIDITPATGQFDDFSIDY
ncbi:MAG: acylphosphatase [Phycisphaeraceae bacterium]|nr:acylphosphatase [Phycisphaeraceae bacterium]